MLIHHSHFIGAGIAFVVGVGVIAVPTAGARIVTPSLAERTISADTARNIESARRDRRIADRAAIKKERTQARRAQVAHEKRVAAQQPARSTLAPTEKPALTVPGRAHLGWRHQQVAAQNSADTVAPGTPTSAQLSKGTSAPATPHSKPRPAQPRAAKPRPSTSRLNTPVQPRANPTPAAKRSPKVTTATVPRGATAPTPQKSRAAASAPHRASQTTPPPRAQRAPVPAAKQAEPRMLAMDNRVRGIDVSSHQGRVNWRRQWNYGRRFAIVKATEGTTYVNPYYDQQFHGSGSMGFLRGGYHFALPNKSSGTAQALFFMDHGGDWVEDGRSFPGALDIEYNPYGSTCYGLSARRMVAWIRDFVDTYYEATGRYPLIYSTTHWWKMCTGNSAEFGHTPLWLARYSRTPGVIPAGWDSYTFWQYSDRPIDQNVYNGYLGALRAFAARPVDPMPGEDDDDEPEVTASPGGTATVTARPSAATPRPQSTTTVPRRPLRTITSAPRSPAPRRTMGR